MKKNETLNDIRLRGHQALFDALGPVGFTRFMQQFVTRGDYVKDRQKWIDKLDLSDLAARTTHSSRKRRRKAG